MNDEHDEHEETNDDYDEDGGRICPVCRGDMVVTGTGMYLFCDTCGHREELDNDDY
jgi:tRNA(Ile2) C34 agmatinyltransferase TiaS